MTSTSPFHRRRRDDLRASGGVWPRTVRTGAVLVGSSLAAALLVSPVGPAAAATEVDAAAAEVDVTDFPGSVMARWSDSPVTETAEEAIDDLAGSKYLTFHPDTWLRFTAETPAVVNRYTITSANDSPSRDPRDWTLTGSTDGVTWDELDARSGQTFTSRFQERSFSFESTTPYRYFHLNVTANNGDSLTQLAEWRLFGPGSAVPPLTAPAEFSARAVSGDQIILDWRNVARTKPSFELERSTDGVNWTRRTLPAGTTRLWHDTLLDGQTPYRYRLRAKDASGSTAWVTASATTWVPGPPAADHFPGHDGLFNRRHWDADVAIYTDSELGESEPWLNTYITDVWRYTKQVYGDLGTPRLYATLHGDPIHAATPRDIFDPSYSNRTAIDVSYGDWSETNSVPRDLITHEIAHLVEFYNSGVQGSPSYALWGDSMWAEIFQYDVYLKTGLRSDAQRWRAAKLDNPVDYPRANTYWFRDWFLPIYEQHGETAVLKKYIDLVRAQYPAVNQRHTHQMTWGEFVHFWSGAAGVDLQPRAEAAFGWSAQRQAELEAARQAFPAITY